MLSAVGLEIKKEKSQGTCCSFNTFSRSVSQVREGCSEKKVNMASYAQTKCKTQNVQTQLWVAVNQSRHTEAVLVTRAAGFAAV